jgi:hypothetical protein
MVRPGLAFRPPVNRDLQEHNEGRDVVGGLNLERNGSLRCQPVEHYPALFRMPKPKPQIEAARVRFIKLGRKGQFEKECIEGPTPCIRLGFRSKQHRESLAGNWDEVFRYWSTTGGKTKGKATEFTNQVRTFYTADEKTLWITFYQRKLYWCFASSKVEELTDGSRIRGVIGKWSCEDVRGQTLHVENLSGSLTKVQGFRGTICAVEQEAYLLQRLNCNLPPAVDKAMRSLSELQTSIQALIPKLGWKDFELLCDLIFTRAGWQRVSSLGKTQKSIDLELLSPVTGKRAFVQVKSQASLSTFLQYKAQFEGMPQFDEMYFVVHSPSADLEDYPPEPRVTVLTTTRLAGLVVSAGLVDWLIRKVS